MEDCRIAPKSQILAQSLLTTAKASREVPGGCFSLAHPAGVTAGCGEERLGRKRMNRGNILCTSVRAAWLSPGVTVLHSEPLTAAALHLILVP